MQSWLKNTVRLSVVVSIVLMSSIAQGSTFDIVLNYNNTPSAAEQAAFEAAEAMWESLIVGYKDEITDQTLEIDVNLTGIDGPGGVLGSAGPGRNWLTLKIIPIKSNNQIFFLNCGPIM